MGSEGLFIWARFPRSRLTSKSFIKFSMCSYERAGRLRSRDLAKRAENFAIWKLHPGYRAGMNSGGPDGIVLHFLMYFPHHNTPFNYSDTALSVTEAMIGLKVKIFVFGHVCFVSLNLPPELISRILAFSHLVNRAEISLMNPRRNSSR